jgi:hypothetical protein
MEAMSTLALLLLPIWLLDRCFTGAARKIELYEIAFVIFVSNFFNISFCFKDILHNSFPFSFISGIIIQEA